MIEGPIDPDYRSLWNSGTDVLSVTEESGVVTVNLSAAAAEASVDPMMAELLVQQLVYTATTDDRGGSVRLLIDGEPAGHLWGAVSWDHAVAREGASQVLAPVLIDHPQQGARLTTDSLSFTGQYLAGFSLAWRVILAGTDETAATGTVEATLGDGLRPFSIAAQVGPGRYLLEVRAQGAGQPSEAAWIIETKEFRVHLAA